MRKNRVVIASALAGALLSPMTAGPVRAVLTAIAEPTASYTAATTLIDISGLTNLTGYDEISGGGLTVTFDSVLLRLTVPTTWGTWNEPPQTESSTPPVLYSNGFASVTMVLSTPQSVFGFEAQPDLSDVEQMTARFFDVGNNLLGDIVRDVSGNAGALLFAASSTTPIASVQFSDAAGSDFAIANVRFSPRQIPEPPVTVLLCTGLAFLCSRPFKSRSVVKRYC